MSCNVISQKKTINQ